MSDLPPEPDEQATQVSYDRVAGEYAAQFLDELTHKPLDREFLRRLAALTAGRGRVVDLGCGPGHVARFLHEQGAAACGVDLSGAMVAAARRAHPGIPFVQGTMRALPFAADSLAGIAAFYSIIHIPAPEIPAALAELCRVTRPGGVLLLAFHIGDEVIHRDEWWGHPVSLDFALLRPAAIEAALTAAGWAHEMTTERPPYAGAEYPSRRAYVWARKPAA